MWPSISSRVTCFTNATITGYLSIYSDGESREGRNAPVCSTFKLYLFILKRCLLLFRKRLQYRVKATKDVQTLGHISPRYSEVLAQNQEKCDLSHNWSLSFFASFISVSHPCAPKMSLFSSLSVIHSVRLQGIHPRFLPQFSIRRPCGIELRSFQPMSVCHAS